MVNFKAKDFKTALLVFFFLTVLTGLIYPLVVTGIAQLFFPKQANGSLIQQGDTIWGSYLIGQSFTDPRYFWSRPSATKPIPYNGASSSGSNLGPSNPIFFALVKERILALQRADPSNQKSIPMDLVTTSGSGLDPEITVLAACYQVGRIARLRHLPAATLENLIKQYTLGPHLGILGSSRVNVLQLNLALLALEQHHD